MTDSAAIYARVSTAQQEDGTSLDTQIAACLALAEERGLQVEQPHIFREQASGADQERLLLAQVRRLARLGVVKAVIVHSPDRLSRDPLHLMVMTEELIEAGVKLLFVQGPSGATAEDKLVRYILGYVGEKEREFITERTMRGKISTAQNGRMPVGAGKGLYGYQYDPVAKRRTILETEAEVAKNVFAWASHGVSLYQIALRLNDRDIPTKGGSAWHPLTVKRMLTNTSYMGLDYYGKTRTRRARGGGRTVKVLPEEEWMRIEGFTPPIIEEAVFTLVQERLKEPSNRRSKASTPYLLTGYTVCGECGSPVVGSQLNRRYRYYRCRATVPTTLRPATCRARYIPVDALEDVVWSEVRKVLENPELVLDKLRQQLAGMGGDFDEEIARLGREIRQCRDQERRLVTLYMYGEIDDDYIRSHSGPLKSQREGYEAELRRLERQKAEQFDLEQAEAQLTVFCHRVKNGMASEDHDGKRAVFSAFRVKVEATRDQVVIKGVVGFPEAGSYNYHCTNIGMTTWT